MRNTWRQWYANSRMSTRQVMKGTGLRGAAILLAAVVMGASRAAAAPTSGPTNWAVLIEYNSYHDQYPDLPVGKWYEYGFKEGVPRLLDMWDRVGVKVTSHMVGQAVERHPELAKEIVSIAAMRRLDTARPGNRSIP